MNVLNVLSFVEKRWKYGFREENRGSVVKDTSYKSKIMKSMPISAQSKEGGCMRLTIALLQSINGKYAERYQSSSGM